MVDRRGLESSRAALKNVGQGVEQEELEAPEMTTAPCLRQSAASEARCPAAVETRLAALR